MPATNNVIRSSSAADRYAPQSRRIQRATDGLKAADSAIAQWKQVMVAAGRA
jgi:hypothetical protein